MLQLFCKRGGVLIIGITGTFASGKDTIADYLEEKGFEHFSLSDELREIAKEKGIDPTRDNLRELGNASRDEFGPDYLPKRVLQRAKSDKVLISSIRQPAEIEFLKKQEDFILIGVDAPIEMRFERLKKRNRPGDPRTLEGLKEKEEKEMQSKGKNCQKLHQCMQMADFTIANDGNYQELYKEVDRVLSK